MEKKKDKILTDLLESGYKEYKEKSHKGQYCTAFYQKCYSDDIGKNITSTVIAMISK